MNGTSHQNAEPQVLVVEDSDDDFETVVEALEASAVRGRAVRATTGDECLALLRKKGERTRTTALVLLDLNIPGLDGRSTLVEIRRDARLRLLPVVVFSTSPNQKDLEFCYHAGANAYHIKSAEYPAYRAALVMVFRYWLSLVRLPGQPG